MTTTDPTSTDETCQDAAQAPQGATTDPPAPQGATEAQEAPGTPPEDDARPHREAARYRTRLREVEAERDTLTQRVAALQRAEVERIAGATVSNPSALWAAGTDLAGLLTETGDVDPAKVRTAATRAAETLGLARPLRNHVPSEGGNPRPPTGGDDMASVIAGY